MAAGSLSKVLATLKKRYGKPKPNPAGRDPLGILVWEMVAYLGGAGKRDEAFTQLRKKIGLQPQALLDASLDELTDLWGRRTDASGPSRKMHPGLCSAGHR